MKNNIELKWYQLRTSYQPSDFSFESTGELIPEEGIIGQESALKALEFGIGLEAKGYNIYVSGNDMIGLNDYVCGMLKATRIKKSIPDDLCYVYNFKSPEQPKAVVLEAGEGRRFKDDMKEFIHFLIEELGIKLESYEIDKQRQKLMNLLEDKKEELLEDLKEKAKQVGFMTKLTKEGIGFIPFNAKNKPITEDEYEVLSKVEKARIKAELEKLYLLSEEALERIRETERIYAQHLEDVDRAFIVKEIGYFIKHLKEAYSAYSSIQEYLEELAEDIVENMDMFLIADDAETKGIKELFPWLSQKNIHDTVDRYEVNLLVDNSELIGAPIVTKTTIGYGDLIGKIQIDSDFNIAKINFNSIRAGLLHKANGGYLVVYAKDLFEYPGTWEALKKVIKTGEICIEAMQNSGITSTINLYPEPIQVAFKVILIGDYHAYRILSEYDDDFRELFKVVADFEMCIESNKDSVVQLGKKIKAICDKQQLPDVSIGALLKLIEFSNRLADCQDKMLSNSQPIINLIREAAMFSEGMITKKHILKAIEQRKYFKSNVEKSINEQYRKDILMIDTQGSHIGQINGLAVYDMGEYRFGRPVRITATTYKGKSGLVDIEHEAGLSGSIHTKGINILTGFLGNRFAQDMPLSLCCRICFEQSYGKIDGDSASSAELYGVLSSLSGIPLRQELAVTGSINQYGEIQPVGGINEKIEGFYKICKEKGMTGRQGVMIPYQNKSELMIDEEVVCAVKQGKFHVYQIKTFQEGIELLTGVNYDIIEAKIFEKLKGFNDISSDKKFSRNKKR